jgi:hypothetical protein
LTEFQPSGVCARPAYCKREGYGYLQCKASLLQA